MGWITGAVETFEKMSPAGKTVVLAIGGITAALWLLHAHPIVAAFSLIVGGLLLLENKFGLVSKAADWAGERFNDLKGVGLAMAEFLVGAFRNIVGAALTMAEMILGAAVRLRMGAGAGRPAPGGRAQRPQLQGGSQRRPRSRPEGLADQGQRPPGQR